MRCMYVYIKIPHFCNNKCIDHGSKIHQQSLGCQLGSNCESLSQPHFLVGLLSPWTSPQRTKTSGLPKMFCTTLRRRPSYASALPSLIASDGLKLRGELNRLFP